MSDHELDRFLSQISLKRLTKFTILDKSKLRKAILKVREDGYALVDQEAEIGFRSIAIPLKKLDGRTIASLNVGVHSEHMPNNAMHRHFFAKLRALADELQRQLI